MPFSADSSSELIDALERTGYLERGVPVPGLLTPDDWNSTSQREKYFKYSAVLSTGGLGASAIFEISGAPCIYFAALPDQEPSPDQLRHLHRVAWNHGLAPLLWLVTPTRVLLYNAYSRPTTRDPAGSKRHLLGLFERTARGLAELNELAGRVQFETGAFWDHQKARSINRRNRVDASLLADLEEAQRQLTNAGLAPRVAQSLLGRSIFVSYLVDRGIAGPKFLADRFKHERVADIFGSKEQVLDLFGWVHTTFNGDLFPLSDDPETKASELDLLEPAHLEIMRAFLAGTDMKIGQGRLWPYDFNYIPVELISSIYEMFAHAGDAEQARERSTHYTPLNLVDLVLSQVTPGLPTNATVLDMSCGSGVFLVEALRRLVARRIAAGETWNRDLVRDTLYRQVYGIDISEGAIRLAAFSLYLTALELDPHPEPLHALRFEPLIGSSLFVGDAFDLEAPFNFLEPFASSGLDAIVGNPPWTRSSLGSSASAYCSHSERNYPRARKSQDQAFLWRSGDFARKGTRIGLILAAKPFFATTGAASRAKQALLSRYVPEVMINLSELRQQRVFPTAIAPAMVLIARAAAVQPTDQLTYVSVDFSATYRRHGIVEIGPENVKMLPVNRVAADVEFLKIATWGTARDFDLVNRLRQKNHRLRDWIKRRKWAAGQGFQKAGGKKTAESLTGKKWLPSGKMPPFGIDVSRLPELPPVGMHRVRDVHIYEGPLVVTNRGIGAEGFFAAYSADDVVYTELYYGISFAEGQGRWAHYLNAVFNSSLATYFLFLTSSTWGIERDEIKPEDVVRLPVPNPARASPQLVRRLLAIEARLRDADDAQSIEELKQDLDDAVFELYGLSATDRILVRDLVEVILDYRMRRNRSPAVAEPSLGDMDRYARQLLSVLNPYLATEGRRLTAEIFNIPDAPLQVVNLNLVPSSESAELVSWSDQHELSDVLHRIHEELPGEMAAHLSIRRNLRIYVPKGLYILKPAQRRFWTESAGLADADAIIGEHFDV